MPSVNAVEIRGLSKRYSLPWKRKILVALSPLDLDIKAGEVYGLLGPNGCGKSTTMKLMLGLIKASAGEVKIFGERVPSLESRRRMGFLPENPYFYKFLNGDETLRFYGKLSGLGGKQLTQRIDELIHLVGLENGRDRPLSAYSKGMLQRIGLAQALLHDPDLLLLDEPTAGVDPMGSRDIRDLILRLRKMGKTVVFSSHLLEQVEEVADRVAIFHLGMKLLEGTLDELLTDTSRTRIITSGLPESAHGAVTDALKAQGATSVELSRSRHSLETLFMETIERKRAEAREADARAASFGKGKDNSSASGTAT
ncbi:MAG: ABC transporter ATP-binding protein [Candidatus Methylacidiphilales bacterium]|nr:ABC transporter ATP-binding protein [Candidatus Methylacidiphilales bacterium]